MRQQISSFLAELKELRLILTKPNKKRLSHSSLPPLFFVFLNRSFGTSASLYETHRFFHFIKKPVKRMYCFFRRYLLYWDWEIAKRLDLCSSYPAELQKLLLFCTKFRCFRFVESGRTSVRIFVKFQACFLFVFRHKKPDLRLNWQNLCNYRLFFRRNKQIKMQKTFDSATFRFP